MIILYSYSLFFAQKAVEAIRQSGNPLKLVVQSLNLWSMQQGFNSSVEETTAGTNFKNYKTKNQ